MEFPRSILETMAAGECQLNQGFGYELAAVVPTVLATGLCDSFCTIQLPDGALIGAGQPSGIYDNVGGLVDIPVISAPLNEVRIQSQEIRRLEDIQLFSPRHVWLAGYFPIIEPMCSQGARAVINGVAYDLMGAEADSQLRTTRISIRTSAL